MHTDVASKNFVAGTPTEFSFTTFANEDKNRMVVGNASFSDPSAIEKLEYYEPRDGQWYPLEGDFGPAQGFPLSDATSKFRVTFNKAGEYSFTAQLVDVADGEQVCSVDADVYVEEAPEVPETGDNAPLMLWAALAMVSLLGVTMIIRRKENA
jgi:LPXTG-motif cell wall-anchored protein